MFPVLSSEIFVAVSLTKIDVDERVIEIPPVVRVTAVIDPRLVAVGLSGVVDVSQASNRSQSRGLAVQPESDP